MNDTMWIDTVITCYSNACALLRLHLTSTELKDSYNKIHPLSVPYSIYSKFIDSNITWNASALVCHSSKYSL